jgi:hypothetical protein
MRIRFRPLAIAGTLIAGTLYTILTGATPASAATTCGLYGWQNPNGGHTTYYPQNYSDDYIAGPNNTLVGFHGGCHVIGVVTQADGIHFQFAVRVQDLDEHGETGWFSDDAGRILAYLNGPETGANWYVPVADQASTDVLYNDVMPGGTPTTTWYSPLYCTCQIGQPENTIWRINLTTHLRDLSNTWHTYSTQSVAFAVHG